MKKFLCITIAILYVLTMFSFCITAESRDFADELAVAEQLKSLGLFKGVSDTDFALEREPSRVEALVMLIRLLGKESEATATSAEHPFTDVADWADKYVAYAYSEGLTNGISASQFGNSNAQASTYLTFVLRALGYSDTNGEDFTWNDPFTLAKEVGILTDDVDTETFLRADVVLVSKNALAAKLKNSDTTLAQKLISEGVFTKDAYNKMIGKSDKPTNIVSIEKFEGKQYSDVSSYPDPFVISFESQEHFEANSALYIHEADIREVGTYSFTDGALRLSYNEPSGKWQGQYRVMFRLETVNFLDPTHTIMQVIYRTDAKSGELRFHNNGTFDEWLVLDEDVSKSGGEWVRSELMELSSDMIQRLNNEAPMTVCLHTSEKDVSIDIKEIKIFCSPEQAMLDMTADPDTNDSQNKFSPAVYRFTSKQTMAYSGVKFYDHIPEEPTEEGVFAIEPVDGTSALRLYYDQHNWGGYRVMFRPYSMAQASKFSQNETWYVRVRYKTNADTFSKLTLTNNNGGETIVLERDFMSGGNEWCVSAPEKIPQGFSKRLASGMWLTLGFHFLEEDLDVYISEIAFFPTVESAYEYYGDNVELKSSSAVAADMKIGSGDINILASDPNSDIAGYWERDSESGAAILKYSSYDKHGWGNYRVMPAFKTVTPNMSAAKYFRIIYKAKNPANAENVSLKVVSNSAKSFLVVEDDVKDTGGAWVASPVQQLSPIIHTRWLSVAGPMHCTVSFYAGDGGEYAVREIVFFKTLEDAMAWEFVPDTNTEILLGENPIDKYTIVIPENAGRRTRDAADILKNHIRDMAGVTLEVITDAEAVRPYEIVIGNTSREVSAPYYSADGGKYVTGQYGAEISAVEMSGNTLVITGGSEIAIEEGVKEFMEIFLEYGSAVVRDKISLRSDLNYVLITSISKIKNDWDDPEPVADPDVFTDNFDDEAVGSSPDYWVEAYAADDWHITSDGAGKSYSAKADDFTYTRLHVYERDVDFSVKMRFDKLTADSDAGLLVRYNEVGAYIRIGYANGQWYLRFSEGPDFNVYTLAEVPYEIKEGTWYSLSVKARKNEIKFYVNGAPVIESEYVTHISPGPMGMFAENADVSFDDVSVTLVSGQGKVMKGVVDSTFWNEEGWLCSGSVFEMKDKTLRYVHSNEAVQYVSKDGGLTWVREKFTDVTTDCVNIYRLHSGNLIKMMEEVVGGTLYHVTYTSSDEGVTWVRGGKLAPHDYKGYGTMIQTIENDKFSQVSNGRLFVSQNYQGNIPSGQPNDHMKVFNEIWYSDDEGKTWKQSEMSSYDCTDSTHIGETKVIETADGALLWITSWNDQGYIIAAESKDNGVTWGDFYNLTQFSCSISSYGIMRDVYADNNTTYYLSWVYNEPISDGTLRSRLCMAKTTDGRNWQFLGDVYRWECNYANSDSSMPINHIVDPFMTVTEDYLFVGSGFSNRRSYGTNGHHNNQQQKVYRIEKAALVAYDKFPNP